MLIILDENDVGEMLISKIDVLVVLLLDASDLLSDDKLLEVNVRMLDLKILVGTDTNLNSPLSFWLTLNNLLENLNLMVMEILEPLNQMIGDSSVGEWWQFWMLSEVLKVTKHWLVWNVGCLVHVLLSFLDGVDLIGISLEEIVDSCNDGLVKI